jgi:hypothetical protein
MFNNLTRLRLRIYNSPHPKRSSSATRMNFFVRTASGRTRTILSRVLAFVLLTGLIQAVTFGSAHSHLNTVSALASGQAAGFTSQALQAVPEPFHYRTERQECLICLFHQQLFSSVVHTPFYVAQRIMTDTRATGDNLLNYSSSFTSTPIPRLSGRAPPRR